MNQKFSQTRPCDFNCGKIIKTHQKLIRIQSQNYLLIVHIVDVIVVCNLSRAYELPGHNLSEKLAKVAPD